MECNAFESLRNEKTLTSRTAGSFDCIIVKVGEGRVCERDGRRGRKHFGPQQAALTFFVLGIYMC